MRLRQSVIHSVAGTLHVLDLQGNPRGGPIPVTEVLVDGRYLEPPWPDHFRCDVFDGREWEFTMRVDRKMARRLFGAYAVSISPVPAKAAHRRKYGR